jgi:hypothetical protein
VIIFFQIKKARSTICWCFSMKIFVGKNDDLKLSLEFLNNQISFFDSDFYVWHCKTRGREGERERGREGERERGREEPFKNDLQNCILFLLAVVVVARQNKSDIFVSFYFHNFLPNSFSSSAKLKIIAFCRTTCIANKLKFELPD